MAYATKEEVAAEFKRISFTGTDPVVNETEVDRFISEAESLINSKISNEYIIPVTDVDGVNILKKISIDFVTFRINKIIKIKDIKATTGNTEQSKNSVYQCYMDSKKMLEDIANGKFPLGDALKNNSASPLSSFVLSNDYCPEFTISGDQW